jgi:hypothetical protein
VTGLFDEREKKKPWGKCILQGFSPSIVKCDYSQQTFFLQEANHQDQHKGGRLKVPGFH